MLINIQTIIIEIIVRLCGCGLSHMEMSIITGVWKGIVSKALRRFRDTIRLT